MARKTIKIVPRGKWVLVKPLKENSRETDLGLLLPQTEEREQKARGTIVSVSREVDTLHEGDEVIYGAYAGENMKVREGDEEVEYKLLLDEDIIAFIL